MSGGIKKLTGAALNWSTGGLYGAGKRAMRVGKGGADPAVTPIPDFEEVARKKRRAEAKRTRGGRSSTMLTEYDYTSGMS